MAVRDCRLWIGTTFAVFHSEGWTPRWKHNANRRESGRQSALAQCFRTRAGMPSGPVAFEGSSCLRCRSIVAGRNRTRWRAEYKGFVRPLMEYCPLVWNGAAPSHLARLDRVQKRALSLIGPGAVVDSLALRRTISGLCVLFKLMCGARLPCMAELLPPPADYANPRTRRQLQAAHGHCFQLKQTLPSRSHNTILQSFPNAHIPIWNSLPSSVLQEAPCLRSLQSFKSKSYKHLLKKDWLWATQAYP